MRAFAPREASLRTSASASGRVLYAASWMVQIPRGVDSLAAGVFVAGARAAGSSFGASVGVDAVAPVSTWGAVAGLGTVLARAPVAAAVLDVRGGGEEMTLGEPDDRPLGATVLGAGVAAVAVAVAAQCAP